MEQQNQTDLLQEVQEEMNYVDPVSPGIRFVNYIIDQVVLLAIFYGAVFTWAIIAYSNGIDPKKYAIFQQTGYALVLQALLSYAVILVYYTLLEAATRGRTMGKLATGTIAITQDGSPFTFKHAFLRSLCRIIPLEPFSAFGYMPWHDSLTNTVVVKKTW